jgi:hypothetical protein
MKVLKSYQVRIVAPETKAEDQDIKRVIREVKEEEKHPETLKWEANPNKN